MGQRIENTLSQQWPIKFSDQEREKQFFYNFLPEVVAQYVIGYLESASSAQEKARELERASVEKTKRTPGTVGWRSRQYIERWKFGSITIVVENRRRLISYFSFLNLMLSMLTKISFFASTQSMQSAFNLWKFPKSNPSLNRWKFFVKDIHATVFLSKWVDTQLWVESFIHAGNWIL